MNFLFDYINIGLAIIFIINCLLGFLIFINGRKKKISRIYSWNIVAIVGWVAAMFFYRSALTNESSLFWCTLLYIFPTFIASSFLYFTYIFPTEIDSRVRQKKVLIFFLNIIMVVMVSMPGFMIESVHIRPNLEKEIIFSWGYVFYFIYIPTYFMYGFYRLLRKYLKTDKQERAQIIYLLSGYAIATNLAFVTNLIMPWWGYFFLNWMGQIFTIFMVAFTAYAIIAHRLMDIKLVLRKYSVYIMSASSVIVPSFAVKHFFVRFIGFDNYILDLLILIFAVSVFSVFKKFFYEFANKYFFSSLYDSKKVISEVSDQLRSTLNIEKLYSSIHGVLESALHFKMFCILGLDQKRKKYFIQYQGDFINGNIKESLYNEDLNRIFITENRTFYIEELKKKCNKPKVRKIVQTLEGVGIDVITPLNIKNKIVGLLLFGPKESGDMYNEEDLKVLNIVGAQAAIAIENALLYEETKNFNARLKHEIEKATEELRIANEDLKQLDRAKSEFISIASHQLRTPLTAVKGFVSMILQGDFGKINKKVNKALADVYESNERLIHLINDLLDVSRIESGRLLLTFKVQQLEDLVESVFRELKGLAEKKGLEFTLDLPKTKLPSVNMDEEKVRQVVMNLMDNAIKYTEKGFVNVSLRNEGDMAVYCVEDSGRGVNKQDLRNLFKKFSRGKGSSVVHTEGTGLGLFVAKQMIEKHNGTAWAESEGEWKGSRFCFSIPFHKVKKK